MLLLAALTAVPACVLVLLGALGDQPLLQAAGVLVGIATGVLLYWSGGRIAARRLSARGAELMDLLHLGPPPLRRATAQGVGLSGRRAAARNTLVTVGILLVAPQGLVPLGFNLLGVDPQVKVWFAARYLPSHLQIPAAVGFIALGLLALWLAVAISQRHDKHALPGLGASSPRADASEHGPQPGR